MASTTGTRFERRAATWLYRYCTGELPPGEAPLEEREVAPLY